MISAIVLAAGLSTRMEDDNKLLLPFNGKAMIAAVVRNILRSGVEEVILVTGHDAEKIRHILKNMAVIIIDNNDFNKGITSSIQKGVSIAGGDGYMICLGDMPLITSEEYRDFKNFFEKQKRINDACICVASYKNKRGNPVVFSSFYKNQIAVHTNAEGCKEIIAANPHNVYAFEMSSDNILKDIDTPLQYRQATGIASSEI